jgi:hypothetical protein
LWIDGGSRSLVDNLVKYKNATLVVFALFTSVVAAACATGNDTVFADGGGSPGKTTSNGNGGGGNGGGGGGTTCMASCQSDQDCQTKCPAAPNGGANCCDSSGMCYVEAAACPAQMTTTGSTGSSMY